VGEQLLGSDHPFVAADRALRQAARTLLFTAVFVVALAAFAYPARSAAVAVPGASVLLYLFLRLAVLADERKELAVNLVIQGGEALPIARVVRLRRTLLGHRRDQTRRSLLRTLDQAADQAQRHPADPRAPILAVADKVLEVADLLQRTRSARAVAMTERLIGTSAGWHMLAFEPDGLARELGRIRFLLLADEAARTGAPATVHR
jgi:hypothetical protein